MKSYDKKNKVAYKTKQTLQKLINKSEGYNRDFRKVRNICNKL